MVNSKKADIIVGLIYRDPFMGLTDFNVWVEISSSINAMCSLHHSTTLNSKLCV